MTGSIEERVAALAEPLVGSLGLELWGVRFRRGGGRAALEIYVDAPDGVSAERCGEVFAVLSPALDHDDPIPGAYVLEVSSPGLDRILFNAEQAARYVGQCVRLELRAGDGERRRLKGELLDAGGGVLRVADERDGAREVAFADIAQARLVPSFPAGGRKNPHSAS